MVDQQPDAFDAVLDAVLANASRTAERITYAGQETVPQLRRFAANASPESRARLEQFSVDHIDCFVRSARERRPPTEDEVAFVADVARRRADQAFPLESLLNGLRTGLRALQEEVISLAPDSETALALLMHSMDYVNAVSRAMTDGYLQQQQALAASVEHARQELFDELLSGRFLGRPDAVALAAAARFDPADHYVVVALTAEGFSLREALARLRDLGLCRPHQGQPVLIAHPPVRVPAGFRAGISAPFTGAAAIPAAYEQARRALRLTSATEPTVDFVAIGPLRYLLSAPDPVAVDLARHYLAPVLEDRRADDLLATAEAYYEHDRSINAAAEQLSIHANTVGYRLRRLEDLLGRRLATPELAELVAAHRLLRDQPSRGSEARA